MPAVQAVLTPLDPHTAAGLLASAFHELTGAWPGSRILALLLSLSDLETATWARMRNFNFGNVIAVTDSAPYFVADDTGNQRKFRAFDSATAGALAFVDQLMRNSRKGWRAGLLSGEPEAFVSALAGDIDGVRYFEADRDSYLKELRVRHARYAQPRAAGVGAAWTDDGSTIPLYPGEVQTWVVALPVQGGNAERAPLDSEAVSAALANMWPEVQALIPGPTSDAQRRPWTLFEQDDKAYSVLKWPQWVPAGTDYVLTPIQFDYLGDERRMPWLGWPLAIVEVWRVEEHIPDSRVHAWLKVLWEASKLASEGIAKVVKDTATKAASSFGFAVGLLGGAALLVWLSSRKKRSRTR